MNSAISEIPTENAEENKLISVQDDVQEQQHQSTSIGGCDKSKDPLVDGSDSLRANASTAHEAASDADPGTATAAASANAAAHSPSFGASDAPIDAANTALVIPTPTVEGTEAEPAGASTTFAGEAPFDTASDALLPNAATAHEAASAADHGTETAQPTGSATAESPDVGESDALMPNASTAPVAAAAEVPVPAASNKRPLNEHIFTGLQTGLSLRNVEVLVVGRGSGTPSLVQYVSKSETSAEITDYPVSSGKIWNKEVNSIHEYPRFFTGQKVLVVLSDVVVPAEVKGLVSCTKKRGAEPNTFQYRVKRQDMEKELVYEAKHLFPLHNAGSTVLIHTCLSVEIGVIASTHKLQDPWVVEVAVLRGFTDVYLDADGIERFDVDVIICEIDTKTTRMLKVCLPTLISVSVPQHSRSCVCHRYKPSPISKKKV